MNRRVEKNLEGRMMIFAYNYNLDENVHIKMSPAISLHYPLTFSAH